MWIQQNENEKIIIWQNVYITNCNNDRMRTSSTCVERSDGPHGISMDPMISPLFILWDTVMNRVCSLIDWTKCHSVLLILLINWN